MTARIQNIAVLGSTGSIGVSTLDVVARHPDRFRVVALSAHSRADELLEQCLRHSPKYAVLTAPEAAERVRAGLQRAGSTCEVLCGATELERVASLASVDTVMAAIVGAAGLKSALAAARAGKRILLANKETLVMAGPVFMEAVRAGGATLLPIDSEHNAIFQSLPPTFNGDPAAAGVRRILLTASGGPFRAVPLDTLDSVTPEQACAHPNWVMGRKISVDSATMMNKGLEVIEARWLFNVSPDKIEVVIHPQSVIHSMVEYIDGSVIAQLGNPDMRTPIAHALAYPERIVSGVGAIDLIRIANLQFEASDALRFPCLGLAFEALRCDGNAPAILNAANEVAVAAFLAREIRFTEIPRLIGRVLENVPREPVTSVEDVIEADRRGRQEATEWLARTRPGGQVATRSGRNQAAVG